MLRGHHSRSRSERDTPQPLGEPLAGERDGRQASLVTRPRHRDKGRPGTAGVGEAAGPDAWRLAPRVWMAWKRGLGLASVFLEPSLMEGAGQHIGPRPWDRWWGDPDTWGRPCYPAEGTPRGAQAAAVSQARLRVMEGRSPSRVPRLLWQLCGLTCPCPHVTQGQGAVDCFATMPPPACCWKTLRKVGETGP